MRKLNPEEPVEKQLNEFGGQDLEYLVSAILHSIGYVCLRNLLYEVSGRTWTEIDIVAYRYFPYYEYSIAIECKGGKPNDILEFAGITKLIKPKDSFFISGDINKDEQEELRSICDKLSIIWVAKPQLLNFFTPFLGPIPQKKEKLHLFNRLMETFEIEDILLSTSTSNQENKDYKRFLFWDIWKISDPLEQMTRLYDFYKDRKELPLKQISNDPNKFITELYQGENPIVQCSLFLQYVNRLLSLMSVIRLATHLPFSHRVDDFIKEVAWHVRSVVVKIQQNPVGLSNFVQFFVHWTKIWGGFISKECEKDEYEKIAEELNIREEDIKLYIEILKDYFSSNEDNLIQEFDRFFMLKLLPVFYRANGVKHRLEIWKDIKKIPLNNPKYLSEYDAVKIFTQRN